MQQGQRPVGVGFFFSVGHSAVVVLLSIGVAFAAAALTSRFELVESVRRSRGNAVFPRYSCSLSLLSISSF